MKTLNIDLISKVFVPDLAIICNLWEVPEKKCFPYLESRMKNEK